MKSQERNYGGPYDWPHWIVVFTFVPSSLFLKKKKENILLISCLTHSSTQVFQWVSEWLNMSYTGLHRRVERLQNSLAIKKSALASCVICSLLVSPRSVKYSQTSWGKNSQARLCLSLWHICPPPPNKTTTQKNNPLKMERYVTCSPGRTKLFDMWI